MTQKAFWCYQCCRLSIITQLDINFPPLASDMDATRHEALQRRCRELMKHQKKQTKEGGGQREYVWRRRKRYQRAKFKRFSHKSPPHCTSTPLIEIPLSPSPSTPSPILFYTFAIL